MLTTTLFAPSMTTSGQAHEKKQVSSRPAGEKTAQQNRISACTFRRKPKGTSKAYCMAYSGRVSHTELPL